ncbi:protein amalgam-like isoform X2 [Eriocheir sinensis]|uniref:protein amalgam-like isoform X2 n=1 Tax=Eriocheir sinensis TaxID=95602 RepID=UPI0021C616F8|nr:protein amalgam-like isoform X2 [Eriocheir sinensis]XP_050710607.1 protein amalgam-like isoform X2 [Eriocheir sinensis]XP_050710617.1 protein amalgam-like isoform X2 [Eriocheir sinensis]XP_050710628.1 protein amalgam-like isoform X2 [Eriocheir sinensis]XP_050710639.1 protein amalgam-like isoform X2 [Eriocheir sinensis]XP_050710650.1 protein amalgam-like isoform X2 [Eriocheir sinensis]
MKHSLCWVGLTPLLLLAPQGLSESYFDIYDYETDYYYDYNRAQSNDPLPTFTARPQTFTVEVGQSVMIPCDVDDPGNHKLIIKKKPALGGKERLLSVGSEKVTRDRRLNIEGTRLTISHARPRDAGTFLCLFDVEPPVQLQHTLDVQFAPSVRSLAPPEQHVPRGKAVTLECRAHGNPEPVIRWTRQEGPLPSGLSSHEGKTLFLHGVDRHVEGTYLCTADNGVGEPASAAMTITVEYPPEITAEKAVVRTGEGDHVELACVVHGRPSPDVIWTRDGHPLPESLMDTQRHMPERVSGEGHHVTFTHVAHRHTLTITNVSEKDFGAYVCIAENPHGQKDAVIQMTGLPKPPVLTSSPIGGESTSYTLTWETESYYPITEFLIRYRKTHLGAWQPNHTVVMAGAWENVSKKVVATSVPRAQRESLTYTLHGLEVASDYVTVVRVRNRYGWSAESDHFHFSTKKAMAVLQSTSGGRSGAGTLAPTLLLGLSLLVLLREN